MTSELTMPALSPTMEKGTLAKWLVAEGDEVAAGDLIAEIETDKATMELEASSSGRIAKLLVAEGTDDIPVGSAIALLGDADAGMIPDSLPASQPAPAKASPAPSSSDADAPPTRVSPADRIRVSPLAARIAAAKDIDLGAITGTGPNGRIVRADLGLTRVQADTRAAPPATPNYTAPAPDIVADRQKLNGMRRTIARRLTESKQTVPHFYLTVRCNLDALLALRQQINAAAGENGIRISVNDMLMKAAAIALAEVPCAHVQFGGDELFHLSRVDIAMAVAIEGGLVTPVIRDVGALSLSKIAQESRALSDKARAGKLLPEDYSGGTLSVSNLGMFGIDEMTPVINPPQALILGLAAAVEQPWKVDGGIALASIMAATASFDHRAIDGATGARFMAAFRAIVETPLKIVA